MPKQKVLFICAHNSARSQMAAALMKQTCGEFFEVESAGLEPGVVYTETVVHLAPERFAADVPYQVAIIQLDDGARLTVRIEGERVAIGDPVTESGSDHGVPFFRKSDLRNS